MEKNRKLKVKRNSKNNKNNSKKWEKNRNEIIEEK